MSRLRTRCIFKSLERSNRFAVPRPRAGKVLLACFLCSSTWFSRTQELGKTLEYGTQQAVASLWGGISCKLTRLKGQSSFSLWTPFLEDLASTFKNQSRGISDWLKFDFGEKWLSQTNQERNLWSPCSSLHLWCVWSSSAWICRAILQGLDCSLLSPKISLKFEFGCQLKSFEQECFDSLLSQSLRRELS